MTVSPLDNIIKLIWFLEIYASFKAGAAKRSAKRILHNGMVDVNAWN